MSDSLWRQQRHAISDNRWQDNKNIEENLIRPELLFADPSRCVFICFALF